jgi:hypothetical protein
MNLRIDDTRRLEFLFRKKSLRDSPGGCAGVAMTTGNPLSPLVSASVRAGLGEPTVGSSCSPGIRIYEILSGATDEPKMLMRFGSTPVLPVGGPAPPILDRPAFGVTRAGGALAVKDRRDLPECGRIFEFDGARGRSLIAPMQPPSRWFTDAICCRAGAVVQSGVNSSCGAARPRS